jgi:hypothetical protein
LQAKQRQELRNRNLKPAERRELIAKQRDEAASASSSKRRNETSKDCKINKGCAAMAPRE